MHFYYLQTKTQKKKTSLVSKYQFFFQLLSRHLIALLLK